jgi:hypothetical protein
MLPKAALVRTLAVVACSREQDGGAGDTVNDAPADCIRSAVCGALPFMAVCTGQIGKGPCSEVSIRRQPDAGFRRFVLIDCGNGLATTDQVDEVQASRAGAIPSRRVARNRYRVPAAPGPGAWASYA